MNYRRYPPSGAGALVLVLASSLVCGPASGTGQSLNDDVTFSRRNAIVTAIASVTPAVVTINVVEIQRERIADPFHDSFMGMFGFGFRRPLIRGRAVESVGTGFLFDDKGHILTNYHVIQNADRIASVTLPDGRSLDVEVVGSDKRNDIAVLRARSSEGLAYLRLGNSDNLLIGEWAIAIGNPFGAMINDPQPSVSVGVVSANHRRVSRSVGGGERLYQDLIQTDAAINPGNSGGPLVNAAGEVVGINTMIFTKTGGHQGLGFAIPINRARRVAEEIIQFGRRRNPWFGFRGEAISNVNPHMLRQMQISAEFGVLVTEILRTSPAFKAGLDLGDVIVAIDGQRVEHPIDIDFINWGMFVGESVALEFDRGGQKHQIHFSVEEVARAE